MVDTVRAEYFGRWREIRPEGWTVIESRRTISGMDGTPIQKAGRMMTQEETGFRIGGTSEYASWFEVSLPRVLFGNNGIMIRTQEQLDDSIKKTREMAASVCEPALIGENPSCTRLDLVGQFLIEPRDMMVAHRETNHPRIRGRKSYYEGESLHFVGKERHCRIYDKMREMQGKPGHVTRVEWQLRGEAMRHDMKRDCVALKNLGIEECYDAYRRLCVEFQPKSLPAVSAVYDILAMGVREGVMIGGIPLFDCWARGKHPKTARRVRNEIAKRRVETFAVDWAKLLPVEMPLFKMVDATAPDPF